MGQVIEEGKTKSKSAIKSDNNDIKKSELKLYCYCKVISNLFAFLNENV